MKNFVVVVLLMSLLPAYAQHATSRGASQPSSAPGSGQVEPGIITPQQVTAPTVPAVTSPQQVTAPTVPAVTSPQQVTAPQQSATGAPVPGPNKLAGKNSPLEDYTSRLKMKPGLTITIPITEGIDTRRQRIGNYDFTATIHDNSNGEFGYNWVMTTPAEARGFRAVAPEDEREALMVSLFYKDKQSMTMSGYTNTLRVSDALYKGLKSGKTMPFQIDLEDLHDVPSRIHAVGREYATVYVEGKKARVRAIKAETDNQWHYWIMDKPDFPIIVKGDGPFKWQDPRFSSSSSDSESRRIINDLEKKGIATSYAILFAFNSAKLEINSKRILNGIASYLSANSKVRLIVEGHCDIVGNAQYNLKLSQRRAEAVKIYLTTRGIAAARLQPKGYGYSQPVADNNTAEGRAKNRRVVFKKF